MTKQKTTIAFEYEITKLSFIISLCPSVLFVIFILVADVSAYLTTILFIFCATIIGIGHLLIWRKLRNQLRTTTNLVEALLTGDSTMRPNSSINSGALAELNQVIRQAAVTLAEQRLVSKEHHLAMSKVLEHINVAVICFDNNATVTLLNPKAQQLFNIEDDLVGMPAKALGIDKNLFNKKQQRVVTLKSSHIDKKVYLQTDHYQLHGKRHTLLFLNDVQVLLQNEERIAWQRLLRVLSHEINNSLAPIASIGESLTQVVTDELSNYQGQQDLSDGLTIMTNRALALDCFIKQYQTLARLPEPSKTVFSLREMLKEQTQLFSTLCIDITNNDDVTLFADRNQLEQVVVNLIKNAQQASKQHDLAKVTIHWSVSAKTLQLVIADNGLGISNPENLFVPFYTTKKNGSGIGLVLSRQIIFNHGGDLTLQNSKDSIGAIATISAPIVV